MSVYSCLKKRTAIAVLSGACICLTSLPALAEGGISIQGTRIIYPQSAKQQSLSVSNSSTTDSFLVQSWVEDASGHKTSDFIVTPPLYLSGPKNENTLRLMRAAGGGTQDREMLFYFVAKAIPSVDDKKDAGKNVLRIATASRIKLFVRPAGLTPAPGDAPSRLEFRHQGERLIINNPTPYYLTLTDMRAGGKTLQDIMVPPKESVTESWPVGTGNKLTFHTINDYGAITKIQSAEIK
ncbi:MULTISPECIES: fimbria/pilus periplasmic chaperone [Erwiniaceae]|uniref:Fimbria/pilus periplasmic chaperone n=2 Tax=Erwiniaceae TaxID=1903409 RepID=A0ACC5PVN8_ENTAG|nr:MULTISPECIES: fimbria/pilus periplasmic chaperone [Erwiniaceae]MBD8109342.1 fimbria/pilus periplasmic chaperone [Erwinia persicina]MBD8129166.1 fimbria/pilus periplasmic chaperone [Pantoea agglomerans]MBD8212490.1 fimbria/pilus periplasmic chaperone [Erwinia persicina]MBD8234821.1 fimbria/pilus periplasmic chaperone [Pantoea agglomerans]MBD8245231.1 fimbria/pilus periplasmic chaperone [Pantoea agglomerans]